MTGKIRIRVMVLRYLGYGFILVTIVDEVNRLSQQELDVIHEVAGPETAVFMQKPLHLTKFGDAAKNFVIKSHYIEKVLKKFNYFDCTSVSTPMDTSKKLMPNNGQVVSQLEYSRVIGCLMYAMTCTRPNIALVIGKLSRYTSNPVLEGYTDASWISNTEDNSSTSGWNFMALAAVGKEA
ncbi:hypothetical protein Tco_0804412 [Tanacetum coccineum]|uniref:Uncharacterized protein n=1 Tax=Tanacetum coccineum TaxID=301880 RepID=A0ABQ5A486_9ASTR